MERTSFHVEELDTAELYKLTTGLIIAGRSAGLELEER